MESYWNENGKRVRQLDWPNQRRLKLCSIDTSMEDPQHIYINIRKSQLKDLYERELNLYKSQEKSYYISYKICDIIDSP
ncbi:unnamed protein product [Blepharisma stoltei]|uniref:Uncharacterized protein n=1 Tax=Blepharisma stoltei TaxID=1481888 RepID=A0AAU9J2X6_9CILI|nr:unnamed protein product [Blepharisma stoltei]